MDGQKIKLTVLTLLILLPLSGSLAYIVKAGIHQLMVLKNQSTFLLVLRIGGKLVFLGCVFTIGLFIGFMVLWFFWFHDLYLPLYIKFAGIILVVPYFGGLATIHALSKGVEYGLNTSKINCKYEDKI